MCCAVLAAADPVVDPDPWGGGATVGRPFTLAPGGMATAAAAAAAAAAEGEVVAVVE